MIKNELHLRARCAVRHWPISNIKHKEIHIIASKTKEVKRV
jgi:hypothetical protein